MVIKIVILVVVILAVLVFFRQYSERNKRAMAQIEHDKNKSGKS